MEQTPTNSSQGGSLIVSSSMAQTSSGPPSPLPRSESSSKGIFGQVASSGWPMLLEPESITDKGPKVGDIIGSRIMVTKDHTNRHAFWREIEAREEKLPRMYKREVDGVTYAKGSTRELSTNSTHLAYGGRTHESMIPKGEHTCIRAMSTFLPNTLNEYDEYLFEKIPAAGREVWVRF